MLCFTIEVRIEEPPDPADDAQLDLWADATGGGEPLPHPPGGTRWQWWINRQPRGVPLVFGRPER